jgi:ketosteroid isomerase-like protein
MHSQDAGLIDEVIEAERRWVQAHRDLDIVTLESMLAEEYVQIRPDGSLVGKTAVLESYRSGNRRWDQADSDQYRVSLFGDVAILVGRWVGRGVNEGEPFDYTARFMTVYVKRDAKWLLVAEQSTPLD